MSGNGTAVTDEGSQHLRNGHFEVIASLVTSLVSEAHLTESDPQSSGELQSRLSEARSAPHVHRKQGHAIAQWLMVLKFFGERYEIRKSDEKLMQQAINEYIYECNLPRMAKLKFIADYLEVLIRLDLTSRQYELFEEEYAKISGR